MVVADRCVQLLSLSSLSRLVCLILRVFPPPTAPLPLAAPIVRALRYLLYHPAIWLVCTADPVMVTLTLLLLDYLSILHQDYQVSLQILEPGNVSHPSYSLTRKRSILSHYENLFTQGTRT